jgi:DNA-binding CsgD family transcriptional regulator
VNRAAAAVMPATVLRVAVATADPARREALRAMVVEAGHELVEAVDSADVVFCDAADVRRPRSAARGFAAMEEAESGALLTPREAEVLACITQGATNKEIGRRLDISLHTVKFHVESLFRKLGVRTRSQAVAKALERDRAQTLEF